MSKKLRRGLAAAAVAGLAIGGTAFAASAAPTPQPLPYGAAGYKVECSKPMNDDVVLSRQSRPRCRLVCVQLPCFVAGPLPRPQMNG